MRLKILRLVQEWYSQVYFDVGFKLGFVFFVASVELVCFDRDGPGTGLPVPRIFVPGTWVPKLGIPGLSQRFLSQSQESQGFVSHGTTLGQPEFFGLLGNRVPNLFKSLGFGCPGDFFKLLKMLNQLLFLIFYKYIKDTWFYIGLNERFALDVGLITRKGSGSI